MTIWTHPDRTSIVVSKGENLILTATINTLWLEKKIFQTFSLVVGIISSIAIGWRTFIPLYSMISCLVNTCQCTLYKGFWLAVGRIISVFIGREGCQPVTVKLILIYNSNWIKVSSFFSTMIASETIKISLKLTFFITLRYDTSAKKIDAFASRLDFRIFWSLFFSITLLTAFLIFLIIIQSLDKFSLLSNLILSKFFISICLIIWNVKPRLQLI